MKDYFNTKFAAVTDEYELWLILTRTGAKRNTVSRVGKLPEDEAPEGGKIYTALQGT